MAEPAEPAPPPRICTIVSRSESDQARALQARLGQPVREFVLDGDGTAELERLFGDEAERFAAGFDEAELTLAALPRLLAQMVDAAEGPVAYVDAHTEIAGELAIDEWAAIRVDPWPHQPGRDPTRLSVLAVPAGEGVRELLARWSNLVTAMLDQDRRLTAATTQRWLSALSAAIPELQIEAAGMSTPQVDARADAPYGFASLPGGIPLTPALRRLLRRAPFPRPFSAPDTPALLEWLAMPAAPERAIPRYLAELAHLRPDLREAYGSTHRENDAALMAWAQAEGRHQDVVLELILPAPTNASRLPALSVDPSPPRLGVNVVGYWRAELGIGDAARLLVAGLDEAQVPVQPISVRTALPPSRQEAPFAAVSPENPGFGINLFSLNPDGLLAFREDTGPEFFARRANIGYWWWEVLDAFPAAWRPAFDLVQEVWVGSSHVRDAIEPTSPVHVRLVPIPVRPLSGRRRRSEMGLPEDFLFVTTFDYNSAFARKNPLATVRAFRAAFPAGGGASLVVKSINGANSPDDRDELAILAEGHPDIHLLDEYMSASDLDALLATADCLVSLHRAEGFGIPLARALRSGIPVVATAYGGNLDFMTEQNSFLVRYQPGTVPQGTLYPAGAPWAEPDHEHASELLREVFEHPDDARRRARVAAASIEERFSPASTGARMALALQQVQLEAQPGSQATLGRHAPPVLPSGLIDDLRELLSTPVDALGGSSRGAQLARRSLERVTHPISDRQRAIDERLLDALARLAEAHERDAELLARLQDQLSRAPASALAEFARELRRDRESVQAALTELREEVRRGQDGR